MRIEPYTQVQQLYQTQKTDKVQKTDSVSRADKLQISSLGKDFQIAKAAVEAAPDVREDVIAPLKEKIKNGTYNVEPGSFAEKLLQNIEEMR
jgi:negative regulator of flagellin synthesis FlgM